MSKALRETIDFFGNIEAALSVGFIIVVLGLIIAAAVYPRIKNRSR